MARKTPLDKRSGYAKSVADHLKPITKRSFGKRGFADGDMIAAWPAVIGEHLARLSAPERVVYPRGKRSGGTLHLRIATGSIAVELQHMIPLLIERINGYFGYRAIDHIRLIQAPIPIAREMHRAEPTISDGDRAGLARMLADVDDPELRASLEKLGVSLISRADKTPLR